MEFIITNETADTGNFLNNLTPGKIFYQATLGLEHLHHLGFSHGNIHQRNVLVAEINNGSTTHYVVKLSDFRFVKRLQAQGSLMLTQSSYPEKNGQQRKNDIEPIAADVKNLGDLFRDVLNGTVKEEEQKNLKTKYKNFIERMKSSKVSDRPSTSQILWFLENNCISNDSFYDDKLNQPSGHPGLCVIFLHENFDPVRTSGLQMLI